MSFLPFFEWCEATVVGEAIRSSPWLFPVIEAVHLLGLAMIGGAVLVVDLRLLDLVLRRQPVAELARDAQPWMIGSLVVMTVTGILLFTSEAIKCYYSFPFWVKMTSLLLAVVFTFTVQRRVTADAGMRPLWRKLAGAASIALWAGVAWGGRWIGFSG